MASDCMNAFRGRFMHVDAMYRRTALTPQERQGLNSWSSFPRMRRRLPLSVIPAFAGMTWLFRPSLRLESESVADVAQADHVPPRQPPPALRGLALVGDMAAAGPAASAEEVVAALGDLARAAMQVVFRSEEHTSELQSREK